MSIRFDIFSVRIEDTIDDLKILFRDLKRDWNLNHPDVKPVVDKTIKELKKILKSIEEKK